ncbi:ABC transporter permease [Stella sp.]|uniref:ABC transporter permease n=1 Tax=Stella sp. TaxID=2912054 RepID=UPI0035B410F6
MSIAVADRPPHPPGFLRRLWRRPGARASLIVLALLGLGALLAPAIARLTGQDPEMVDLLARLEGPSLLHPLGTDELGRDTLLRLLHGGRVSLLVGLVGAVAAAAIGSAIGLAAGYFGGRIDTLLMRVCDAVIALPMLPLLIVLAAIDLEKLGVPAAIAGGEDASVWRIVALVALAGWTGVARLVRAGVLSLRERDFVVAAVAIGCGPWRIMLRHLLPNTLSPILVATTLSVGSVILVESVLSFLGLGIQPPMASWGSMLTNAQELVTTAPLLAVYPGLLIFATVVACNVLGDALQEALDPQQARGGR